MTRRFAILCLLAGMAPELAGCGQGGPLSDAGANVASAPEQSQYLDLSALSGEGGAEEGWNSYNSYTLSYGTFSTQMVPLRANLRMLETACVKAEYSRGAMRLTEMLVEKYQYITAGTPVARVSMEIDQVDLQELERKLLRQEQRYLAEQEAFLEAQEKREAAFAPWPPQRTIDEIRYRQAQLDFDRTAAGYERQMEDLREQIEELGRLAGMTEILAREDGFVLEVSALQRGQKLENGAVLLRLAPADRICLEFADSLQHYGFGNRVTLLAGETRVAQSYDAWVASAVGKVLSSQWDPGVSRLEGVYDIAELVGNGPFNVTGETSVMENVLLVPTEAVTAEKQKYYVTVLGEGGSMTKTQFIPGGSNGQYYWVFDGLEEGTRIVVP